MNTESNMIIIKNKIKTSEIISCEYNNCTKKWDVKFNNYINSFFRVILRIVINLTTPTQ